MSMKPARRAYASAWIKPQHDPLRTAVTLLRPPSGGRAGDAFRRYASEATERALRAWDVKRETRR